MGSEPPDGVRLLRIFTGHEDEFAVHASTHGQQFWLLDQLGGTAPDGTERDAILWDLAGQPDYRLIHALYLEDADLALVRCAGASAQPGRAARAAG